MAKEPAAAVSVYPEAATFLNAAAKYAPRCVRLVAKMMFPVDPAVALTPSNSAIATSAPVAVWVSARSYQVPAVGSVVVLVAPDAVEGSVASMDEKPDVSRAATPIATISASSTVVVTPPVKVDVDDAPEASVMLLETSSSIVSVLRYAIMRPMATSPPVRVHVPAAEPERILYHMAPEAIEPEALTVVLPVFCCSISVHPAPLGGVNAAFDR